ncbi:MAG: FAD-dependent oxidoreductase [Patescibacteria group bacterium]
MKIGIIGAGFTGLSAGYNLLEKGHDVIIFEKDSIPGGLALGFNEKEWDWTLEKHYHHWFTNDKFILGLAKEIGHEVIIERPKTSVLVEDEIFQFDSPLTVIKFPKLTIFERLRMGFAVASIRYNPIWKPLEKINATTFLPKIMGERGYKMIWEPLFKNKFGQHIHNVSLAWIWARLVKRTSSLAYPSGGFSNFADHLVEEIKNKGGKFYFNTQVLEIDSNGKPTITFQTDDSKPKAADFDKVIVTLPSFLFLRMVKNLPLDYIRKFAKLKGLGATNLMLRLSKPFLTDGTYWLNVCDENNPIMAIVDHSNFMDKKYYNNEHLLYLGNYLEPDSKRFAMNKDEVLKLFDPFLRKINPDYKKHLIGYELFKVPFAQPVIPTNYSKMIPPFETPLPNVYLANIEQVYPWDRGTNYAVELGEKITEYILAK